MKTAKKTMSTKFLKAMMLLCLACVTGFTGCKTTTPEPETQAELPYVPGEPVNMVFQIDVPKEYDTENPTRKYKKETADGAGEDESREVLTELAYDSVVNLRPKSVLRYGAEKMTEEEQFATEAPDESYDTLTVDGTTIYLSLEEGEMVTENNLSPYSTGGIIANFTRDGYECYVEIMNETGNLTEGQLQSFVDMVQHIHFVTEEERELAKSTEAEETTEVIPESPESEEEETEEKAEP